jgi:hypothetical protein
MTAEIDLDGHRLVAVCPKELNPAAESLLAKFAELHSRGPKLHPGSIIDFGWAPLRIDESGDAWFVCEPNFAHDAASFVPGVAVTLRVLDDQARIVRLLGVTPLATRFDQTVLVDERTWHVPDVIANRLRPGRLGDSGWYIMPDETELQGPPPEAQPIVAGKIAISRPGWVKVFALPPGHLAVFRNSRLVEIYDENSHQVASFKDGDNA